MSLWSFTLYGPHTNPPGFLPHSVRLTLREHNFDLSASCEAEKAVWSAALCEARDEGVIPPFELPASVSPFAARSRRMSNAPLPDVSGNIELAKRHSLTVTPNNAPIVAENSPEPVADMLTDSAAVSSPIHSDFGPLPRTAPSSGSTILLRRPSANTRTGVDRALLDVFSESCAQARSKAQLHQALFLPDMPPSELRDRMSIRDSTMLRRRKSFLDHKVTSFDIAFKGEVRGSIMPVRLTKSHHGRARGPRTRRGSIDADSATETVYSAEETSVDSDHGHHRRAYSGQAGPPPPASSASHAHRFSMSDLDHENPRPSSIELVPNRSSAYQTLPMRVLNTAPSLNRRKTASYVNLHNKPSQHRTRSMPVSPALSPNLSESPPPVPPKPYAYSAERAAYSRRISHFPINTDVETAGLGLIESTIENDRPKWQTLRRSMSFLRSNKSDDASSTASSYFPTAEVSSRPASLIGNSSTPSFNLHSMTADGSGSTLGSSTDELSASHRLSKSSNMLPAPMVPSKEDDDALPITGYVSAPTTPKRKKSLLLTRLRGFTPM